MQKPCLNCKLKDDELARLRAGQNDQIKAHVHDAEAKSELELARWSERFDRLLRMAAKASGITY